MITECPELNMSNYNEDDVADLNAWAIEAANTIDKLQAFKDYVHQRLTDAGVPEDPSPQKTTETGCRVGQRFNWLFAKNERLLNAIKLVELQYLGCGGRLTPDEVVCEMRNTLQQVIEGIEQ